MSTTNAVWDALVDPNLGAVDIYGGMDHLPPYIGKGKKLPAYLLVWLTDRTLHEALAQKGDVTTTTTLWIIAHPWLV